MLFPLYDLNPHRRFPWLTLLVIGANGAVMIMMTGMNEAALTRVAMRHGFMPARLTHVGQGKPIEAPFLMIDDRTGEPVKVGELRLSTAPSDVYPTFLTTMFLHGGFLHVAGNMLYLWIFGDNVEDRMGHGRFLAFYLLCGVAAALGQTFTAPNSIIPMVGASGAVAGVMGAYFVLYPRSRIVTLLPLFIFIQIIEVPAIFFLGVWFVMQFLSGIGSIASATQGEPAGGVAFWAHISGFAAGLIGVFAFRRPQRERVEWWNDLDRS